MISCIEKWFGSCVAIAHAPASIIAGVIAILTIDFVRRPVTVFIYIWSMVCQADSSRAESAQRVTGALTQEQIAAMSPLDVMLHAMKLEVENAQWRIAAVFAEKAAPYIHPRLASEVHRISTDDSKRNTEELQRELADLDRAAEIYLAVRNSASAKALSSLTRGRE